MLLRPAGRPDNVSPTCKMLLRPAGSGCGVRLLHLRVCAIFLPQDSPKHASSGDPECNGEREPGFQGSSILLDARQGAN